VNRILGVLKWIAVGAVCSLVLVYAGDYGSARYRLAHRTSTNPIEVLKVRPTYAIARKDGRSEFDFGDTESETCVHSLFPHFGYPPCWYANRENQKPIPIG
jgi:hypothetical protein